MPQSEVKQEPTGAAPRAGGFRTSLETLLLSAVMVLVTLALGWLKLDLNRSQDEVRKLLDQQIQLRADMRVVVERLDEREAQVIDAVCHADKNARYDANRTGCTLSTGLYLKYTPLNVP